MLTAKQKRRERPEKEAARVDLQKEKQIRVNTMIPASLHRKLKMSAMQCDFSLTDFVELILKENVDRYTQKYSKEGRG